MAKPQVEILLTADDSKLKNTVKSIESEIKKMAKDGSLGVMALGTAFAYLGKSIKDTLDTMDQISKMSSKTGFSVEDLSALKYAAELSDVSLEQLELSFVKLSKSIDSNSTAFSKIGVNIRNENGTLKKNQEVLLDVADAFAGMEDGAKKTATATEIFGKSGANMIPLLNSGSEAIKAQMIEAENLGITFDAVSAKQAERFNDSVTTITSSAKGFTQELVIGLMPAIDSLSGGMEAASGKSTNLKDKLSPLQAIARGIAMGFHIAGSSIMWVYQVIRTVVTAIAEYYKIIGKGLSGIVAFAKGDIPLAMSIFTNIGDTAFSNVKKEIDALIDRGAQIYNGAMNIAWGTTNYGKSDKEINDLANQNLGKNKNGLSENEDGVTKKVKQEKAKEKAKENEYTAEEKLKDLYEEKMILADDELEKAELNLELKGKLYDLAMKGTATDEEKKKVWLELLKAQQEYIKAEDEARKKRQDEIAKMGKGVSGRGDTRRKEYKDIKESGESSLKTLQNDNRLAGLKGWELEQAELDLAYKEELDRIELSNHYNKEAQKFELEKKYTEAKVELEKRAQAQKLEIIENALASAGNFLAKNTAVYKAFATVQATIDTYLAASKALASYPPPFGAIAMGTAIATGLANVATIQGIEVPGYATGGFALVGEKGPEIIAPMQDYASGQVALINAVMSRMGNVSPGEGLQKFEIRGDNLVTINDRNKHIKARKAW